MEKANGNFGAHTTKAVAQFQMDNGLRRTDGVVDKETWNAIQAAYYRNAQYTDQTVTMGKPINNIDVSNMSDPYGYRVTNISGATTKHQGVDFKAGGVSSPPVSSMMAGTVVVANSIKLRGNTVLIRSTDNSHIYVLLQHLDTMD